MPYLPYKNESKYGASNLLDKNERKSYDINKGGEDYGKKRELFNPHKKILSYGLN